jgi:hypothetical protein
LTDGKVGTSIDILNCCTGALIEVVEIAVEFANSEGDGGGDGLIDGGYSVGQLIVGVVDGEVGVGDHLTVSNDTTQIQN